MPNLSLPPPAALHPLAEGMALGVWRLREPLHMGEAGQWYRAVHAMASGHNATLLLMPRDDASAGAMLRFAEQAGDISQLAQPGISVPSDSGVAPTGQPYLVLGAAAGRPIHLIASSLPLRARLALMLRLCEVLSLAHAGGWMLAEVDPEAIWVDGSDLTLMGLALRRLSDTDIPLEFDVSDAVEAKPWLAPEQSGGGPPTPASEAYGVGALLHLLVEGHLPLEQSSAEDRQLGLTWNELSPLERLSLDALLRKAIAPRPQRRHGSVEALAADLRAWLAGSSHSALRITPMPVPEESTVARGRRRWPAWLWPRTAA